MAEGWVTAALVEEFRRSGVPRDIRLMAAQGLLPLKPEDLLELWTDMVSDADEGVRAAAGASLKAFPVAELLPIIRNRKTPASVLSWAVSSRTEPELREAALQNVSLPDETIEKLAPTLPQALADLVVINQTRLLRSTTLLVAIEGNAGLNNDQKRRLRELRETFPIGEPEPVPSPAAAPEPKPPEPEPEIVPASDIILTEDKAIIRYLPEEERQQTEKVNAVRRIFRLNTAERLTTALKGSREDRAILIRDSNRLVRLAVLSSPRLTEVEVESFSARQDVSDDVLRYIGRHGAWTKRYMVLYNLVRNPGTPVGVALGMVPRLNSRDVKGIAGDRNAREPVRKRKSEVTASDARALGSAPAFSPEERELLVRLSGLFIKVNRSLGAIAVELTAEQRQEIEATLDRARTALREGMRDELRACVEGMQRADRLLEERSGASLIETTRAAAPETGPTRSESPETPVAGPPLDLQPARSDRGTLQAEKHYGALVRARLADAVCRGCRGSLESASLVRVETSLGNLLNEFQLSDAGAARLLAATDDLVVTCSQCGARNVVPGGKMQPAETPIAQRQEPDRSSRVSQWVLVILRLLRNAGKPVDRQPAESPTGPQQFDTGGVPPERHSVASATGSQSPAGKPWSAKAVKLYDKLVRARLRKCSCSACGASLAAALLIRTDTRVGLELNEFELSDEGAALYLAATDVLVVTCSQCGARNEVVTE